MSMFLLVFMMMIVMSLISVAFITLMERKILGLMQIRLGPNKIGTLGILQPIADAVKLYSKEFLTPNNSNKSIFFFCPSLSLSLAMISWITMPFISPFLNLKFSLLCLMTIMGISIYPILIAGWSSNSNYSLLGGMRSLAQSISYEVSLIFIILSSMLMISSMKLMDLMNHQKMFFFGLFLIQTFLWIISCLAEMSRTPFDFAEGESELVSGFNTEYSSGFFAMIFMAEYMMILFFSYSTSLMYVGFNYMNPMNFISILTFMFLFIWTRASFPRHRYDKLMYLCWKIILPISTINLILICFLCLNKC